MTEANERSTVMLRGLTKAVDSDLLFELGTQFGVVKRVSIPFNASKNSREEYGFIEFASAADAQYMHDVLKASVQPLMLHGKEVTCHFKQQAGDDAAADALVDIGARIVVSNLDSREIDVRKLTEFFTKFGRLALPPKITPEPGHNNASATIVYTHHDFSDAARAATNGKMLFNRVVHTEYAMKADGSGRHGSAEERALYAAAGNDLNAAAALYAEKQAAERQEAAARLR